MNLNRRIPLLHQGWRILPSIQHLPALLILLDFSTGGGVTWLEMAVEEGGGTGGAVILPPGGGGSRLSPPDPATRGLGGPPFLVIFCKKKKDKKTHKNERSHLWQEPAIQHWFSQADPYPNAQLDGLSFFEPQVQLGACICFLGFLGDFRLLFHPPRGEEQLRPHSKGKRRWLPRGNSGTSGGSPTGEH